MLLSQFTTNLSIIYHNIISFMYPIINNKGTSIFIMWYVTLVKNIHTNEMATVHISVVCVAQQMSFQ